MVMMMMMMMVGNTVQQIHSTFIETYRNFISLVAQVRTGQILDLHCLQPSSVRGLAASSSPCSFTMTNRIVTIGKNGEYKKDGYRQLNVRQEKRNLRKGVYTQVDRGNFHNFKDPIYNI